MLGNIYDTTYSFIIKEIGRETPPREALASLGGVGFSVVWVLVGGV